MNNNSQAVSVAEDSSTSAQFVSVYEISKFVYLAMHPEEIDATEDDMPCAVNAKSIELELVSV